jgi:methionyl-tRNA formyltransferase
MTKALRVVFMGTPEFAVNSLHAIHQSIHQVVAVVTVADKPAGRGKKLRASAVKEYAISQGLPVLQPDKLRDPEFVSELQSFQADVFVVVAFRMLPKVVWAMPPKGTFNLHASLLPQYRGAAPINWAVINGEHESGVSTFLIDEKIDTGHIMFQKKCAIEEKDNAGDLHDKLMHIGSQLVVHTLDAMSIDNYPSMKQEILSQDVKLKAAPKIFSQDCQINWNQSARDIHNLIRGLSPYPAAFTFLHMDKEQKRKLKLFATSIIKPLKSNLAPGELYLDGAGLWYIQTADDMLAVEELQLEGKKKMKIRDFINGFRIDNGARFQ